VLRPVYYSELLDRANNDLGLSWVLKVTNHEAPLNELQVETHFRSIDQFSARIDQSPRDAQLYFGRGMDFAPGARLRERVEGYGAGIGAKPEYGDGSFRTGCYSFQAVGV